jgi:glycerate 2-kinase
VAAADWVLTGEGRFDASSWAGKGPGALVRTARRLGRRWAVFAGTVTVRAAPRARGSKADGTLVAITARGEPLHTALPRTSENLARSVQRWLDGQEGEAPG